MVAEASIEESSSLLNSRDASGGEDGKDGKEKVKPNRNLFD